MNCRGHAVHSTSSELCRSEVRGQRSPPMGQAKSLIRKTLCGQDGDDDGKVNADDLEVLEESAVEGQIGRYRPLHNSDSAEVTLVEGRGHGVGEQVQQGSKVNRKWSPQGANGKRTQVNSRPKITKKLAQYKCCRQHRSVRWEINSSIINRSIDLSSIIFRYVHYYGNIIAYIWSRTWQISCRS